MSRSESSSTALPLMPGEPVPHRVFRSLSGGTGGLSGGLLLWWTLSVGAAWETWSLTMMRPPRRPRTMPTPSAHEAAYVRAAELATLRSLWECLLGGIKWAKPPKGTPMASALRGFLLATALLLLLVVRW
jgi:hypothetical protein